MKRVLLNCLYLLGILIFASSYSFAQKGIEYPQTLKLPEIKIYDSGKIENFRIKAQDRAKAGQVPMAAFDVTYIGFSADAKLAFAKAVELWSYLVYSTDTIRINATWKVLEEGILGSCGPDNYFRNFKNAPVKNTWYPVVIANKLAGFDLDPGNPDMSANFNSGFSWYLGLDGNCPLDQYDLISTVMHEIGHGLGFLGSASVDGVDGSWGYGTDYPFVYDHFVYNGTNKQIINTTNFVNPSAALKTQFTSNSLFFKSELANAANAGGSVNLYAPTSWNEGSSYSHLGEIFNGTDNSMMTFSAGFAEVTHHPGPITLAMFAEMGWIQPVFKHRKIKDIESMTSSLDVFTDIFADSSIFANSVKFHYSTNNFVTDTVVVLSTINDTLYSGTMPQIASGVVKYYFECQNTQGRTYYYPVQGKQVVTTIDSTLSFTIGTDTQGPIIEHDQKISTISIHTAAIELLIGSDDNVGVDSVYIEYKVNSNASKFLTCDLIKYDESEDLFLYKATISLSGENLSDGDILYYKIYSVDIAQTSNLSTLPQTSFFEIKAFDIGQAVNDVVISFDELTADDKLILDGLFIGKPAGFSTSCLNSPHPYKQGDGANANNEINYTATLKTPIVLKSDDAYIQFNQIAIVEPGETGAVYGGNDFYDYVVVEGSKDTGKTWHAFESGWDCMLNSTFSSAYNSSSAGTESMYKIKMVNLLGNPAFKGTDTVLVRFRLYSDQLSVGWGWAVDDLKIQGEVTSIYDTKSSTFRTNIYPNPSKGNFNFEMFNEDLIQNITISIYSIEGVLVYKQTESVFANEFKSQINLTKYNTGNYIIKINTGKEILVERIIIK